MVVSATMETVVPHEPPDFSLAYFLQLWTHTQPTGHVLTVEEPGGLANLADVPEAKRVSWLSIFWPC